MARIEKTVFISYRRRTNAYMALAVFQHLTSHGYDVFFDYQGIASGDFEQVILANIRARAHFLVILSLPALKRLAEPGDWLRREIEAALESQRNIVPLLAEGFDFSTPVVAQRLSGSLEPLRRYNGLSVPVEYFDAAMEKLRTKHLNVALDSVLHPLTDPARQAAREQVEVASAAPSVRPSDLTAEQWFERGYRATATADELYAYSQAIALRPDYADAYNNRGLSRVEAGDLQGAVADYDEALRLTPEDPETLYNRGIARARMGDLPGAVADYTAALRLKPDDADTYHNRGLANADLGDLPAAMADYTEALRFRPGDADAHNNRGLVRADLGDLTGAVADYKEALRLAPDHAEAYSNRGLARAARGHLSAALRDYDQALRLRPGDYEVYYNRGLAHAETGDFRAAIADYSEALRLRRDDPDLYTNRGLARAALGELRAAVADYTEAIRLNPADPDPYYNRALIWRAQGSNSRAIRDLQRYLECGGGVRDGDQRSVERTIRDLRRKVPHRPAKRKSSSRR